MTKPCNQGSAAPTGDRVWSVLLLVFALSIGGFARPAFATTIDLMLVYDTTATAWVGANGGITAFSQDAVNRMNQAMNNSDIDLTFRLVHTMTIDYRTRSRPETSLSGDLDALQSGQGIFAQVHAARDAHGADLVAMLVDHGSAYGTIGIGYMLDHWSGQPNHGFTVNAIRAVELGHTLTHEIGHNLGAHHSADQIAEPGPNRDLAEYAAGWYFQGTDWIWYHTIMAYDNDGYGSRYSEAPLFSNPLRQHQGTLAGDAWQADNARLINETKSVVAAYRASQSVPTHRLTVNSSGVSGVAIGSGSGHGGTTNYTRAGIVSGTHVALGAPASSGTATFRHWSDCDTTSGSDCAVIMNADRTVTAIYLSGGASNLGAALDAPDLTWSTSGDAPWIVDSGDFYHGGASVRSGRIGDYQTSCLNTTIIGPATLSFFWKVSSESDYDFLHFKVNDNTRRSISGERNWTQVQENLAGGTHSLQWCYEKDVTITQGSDAGWVDRIRITQQDDTGDPQSMPELYVLAFMRTLAGVGVHLNHDLLPIFARILMRHLDVTDGRVTEIGVFEQLVRVFTFVASPPSQRRVSPFAYGSADIEAARDAANAAIRSHRAFGNDHGQARFGDR